MRGGDRHLGHGPQREGVEARRGRAVVTEKLEPKEVAAGRPATHGGDAGFLPQPRDAAHEEAGAGRELRRDGADVAIQVLKAMPDSSQKRAKPCDGADEVVHVLPHSLKVHESPKALVSIEV